jgi:hypothetical protein
MMASEEPIVATPTTSSTSGAFQRSASIFTQNSSTCCAAGYSSWSMWLVLIISSMSIRASGSIHVVTKVARLRLGCPSSFSPSRISSYASRAGIPRSGKRSIGSGSAK